ncbi:putative immunity protein [Virgibacillus salinus]|uniref:Imm-5-like domain-containing protein n=1 Tax=Virgibacillus salinus TaxID=553311 RepID=A0A1H1EMC4_9BACI|nr:hypothetical protein [Virgibacillus salinus]SDQ89925.1 hypothetical protein SAMN05216231_2958 [Virgibacillus salinus]
MEADSDMKKEIAALTIEMGHRTLATWATDCAEHVLFLFEDEHPHDNRPRKAVEAGRAWIRGELSVSEARSAAVAGHAAARDTEEDCARATSHAAAIAHVAGHTVHAANYAAKADNNERAWQYQHLLELMDDF